MLEAWSRVAASGGAACVSGWELQLPTDGRPLPVPQSNAYSHSFERESKKSHCVIGEMIDFLFLGNAVGRANDGSKMLLACNVHTGLQG